MEEKKTTGVLNLINPKKKSTTPKKTTAPIASPQDSKDAEARAKVEELLKGTSVSNVAADPQQTTPEYNVEEIKQEKSAKWMDDQINLLNRQVEEQENEILFYKAEIQRLQANQGAAGVPVNAGVQLANDMPPNLVNLFRHFEKIYEAGYTDAKIAHAESGNGVLDKMMQYFPELATVRRYRYRGQGR